VQLIWSTGVGMTDGTDKVLGLLHCVFFGNKSIDSLSLLA